MPMPTETIRRPVLQIWSCISTILTILYNYWVYVRTAFKGTPPLTSSEATYLLENKQVTKTMVSKHMCLRKVQRLSQTGEEVENPPKVPLVLFFPWLTARERSLDRYCNLYHERGWDVLTIQGRMQHFLWPRRSETVALELLTYLTQFEAGTSRPLVVHAASIGAYLFTVFAIQLKRRPRLLAKFQPVIRAQIFDSIVIGGLGRMGDGIATSLTKSRFLRSVIRGLLFSYFRLTKRQTVDFYDIAVSIFYENPISGNMLFFYSCDDPMCDPTVMEDLLQHLKANSENNITHKNWLISEHAGHLRLHTEEYTHTFDAFLCKLNLEGTHQSMKEP